MDFLFGYKGLIKFVESFQFRSKSDNDNEIFKRLVCLCKNFEHSMLKIALEQEILPRSL
jgi:hypothetical protein